MNIDPGRQGLKDASSLNFGDFQGRTVHLPEANYDPYFP
jgi:hypothetical protein